MGFLRRVDLMITRVYLRRQRDLVTRETCEVDAISPDSSAEYVFVVFSITEMDYSWMPVIPSFLFKGEVPPLRLNRAGRGLPMTLEFFDYDVPLLPYRP